MEESVTTFEEVLGKPWTPSVIYRTDDAGIKVNGDELFILPLTWGDFKPACFDMKDDEREKLFNLLLYAKDMYNMINSLDTEEAKNLVKKIQEEKNMKVNF